LTPNNDSTINSNNSTVKTVNTFKKIGGLTGLPEVKALRGQTNEIL